MRYSGGKGASGVHQQIINRMPKHSTYIETHLGGGNILIKKKPCECTIAIEIDTAALSDFKRYHNNICNDAISFYNEDCIEVLKKYKITNDTLVYADPPYLFETRKNKKNLYNYEYEKSDHIQLLTLLNKLKCFVMISGYQSNLYNELLKKDKWYLFTFNSMTRQGVRTEALWCNFNPNNHIKHDYSYMGENFRERERLKRKSERWIKRLQTLPSDERNFLLSNITDNFGLELSNHF